jgi:hypothetical protein
MLNNILYELMQILSPEFRVLRRSVPPAATSEKNYITG